MNFSKMRGNFINTINLLIESKWDNNKTILSASEYEYCIGEIKEVAEVLSTRMFKKTTKHYTYINIILFQ